MPNLQEKFEASVAARLAGHSPVEELGRYQTFLKVESHRLKIRRRAGASGREVCHGRAMLVDVLIRHLWDTAKINLQGLAKALERFNDKLSRYPTDDEGLKVLWDKSSITDEEELKKWSRFMDQTESSEKDPWGTAWSYKAKDETSEENTFDLWSYGPDKQDGTDDDIHLRPRNTDGSSGGSGGGTGNPKSR